MYTLVHDRASGSEQKPWVVPFAIDREMNSVGAAAVNATLFERDWYSRGYTIQ
jgi:hypothetical protein